MNTVRNSPAVAGGLAFAVAIIGCRLAGVDDPDTITYMAVVAGSLPAAAKTWVKAGGVKGLVSKFWRGS